MDEQEHAPAPRVPGALLLHPVPLLALAVLIVNDHALKPALRGTWASVVTGKLSDAAGMVFFPLLLFAGWQYVSRTRRPRASIDGLALAACTALTALGFALVQVWAPAGDAYRVLLAAAQWPVHAALALATSEPLPGLGRVHLTRDATDVLVVPLVLVPYAIGRRVLRGHAPVGHRSSRR